MKASKNLTKKHIKLWGNVEEGSLFVHNVLLVIKKNLHMILNMWA